MLAVTLQSTLRPICSASCVERGLGLPTPWDQQWSLRMQQVLAFETDLLNYDDIFDGSHVIEQRTAELREAATKSSTMFLSSVEHSTQSKR